MNRWCAGCVNPAGKMQDPIVSLWEEYGFTVPWVTHDERGGGAMADRVLLIEEVALASMSPSIIARPRRPDGPGLAELQPRC